VASEDHAYRLFPGPAMGNARRACIEMVTECKGACVVKLTTTHNGTHRYEVRRLNNAGDVVAHSHAACVDALHEVGQLVMVVDGKEHTS
jgi:hypothetical protein